MKKSNEIPFSVPYHPIIEGANVYLRSQSIEVKLLQLTRTTDRKATNYRSNNVDHWVPDCLKKIPLLIVNISNSNLITIMLSNRYYGY